MVRGSGIKAVIPEPRGQHGHRKRRDSQGGRPVGLDKADCIKQWRGQATRYNEHAIVYRAAVPIHGVSAWTNMISQT